MYQIFQGNITPEKGTIFVFGSNPEGRHGAGSAAVAVRYFGAQYGNGEGLQGSAYALPTTELRPERWVKGYNQSIPEEQIVKNILRLYSVADANPNLDFKVAYRNAANERTLCGYSGAELMSLFKEAAQKHGDYPDNIFFSQEWADSGCL